VRRQKRAGLIVVGKTNVPEFGILPTTESTYWGRCKNPWDTSRTTGGSSGGSAAAVASRWVPMAHANDGGGSIRIPASCCGLFGLKPTRGRNPLGPDHGDLFHGLVVEHAVTRSVRDSAALLDATAGPDVGDPYAAPAPERPYADEVGRDPGRLRIAVTRTATSGVPIHADCVAAVDETAKLLESLGHHVEEGAPQLDGEAVKRGFISMWGVCIGAAVDEMAALVGRTVTPDNVEPLTWAMCQMSATTSAREHLRALAAVRKVARQVSRFFVDYDLLLSPTNAEPPPALGSFDAVPGNPLAGLVRAGLFVPFTPIANVTGQPAMSLPLHMAGGLPIGVQVMGRFGAEGTLFRLAAQLEAARPWAHRRPPPGA
jgi:amidase